MPNDGQFLILLRLSFVTLQQLIFHLYFNSFCTHYSQNNSLNEAHRSNTQRVRKYDKLWCSISVRYKLKLVAQKMSTSNKKSEVFFFLPKQIAFQPDHLMFF